jgi:ubiquinone/menaquinone biosynthesis C-methylase UbiE
MALLGGVGQIMNDRDFDDQRDADDWISVVESNSGRSRLEELRPLISALEGDQVRGHVLDIGCGQGQIRSLFDPKRWTYWGVDPSPYLISRAIELNSEATVHFIQGSAYSIPFDDAHFSAAISINVWHLLRDINQAAKEIMRILKPNARFLIVTAHPDSIDLWTQLYQSYQRQDNGLVGFNVREDGSKSVDELYFHKANEIRDVLLENRASNIAMRPFRIRESFGPVYLAISGNKLAASSL